MKSNRMTAVIRVPPNAGNLFIYRGLNISDKSTSRLLTGNTNCSVGFVSKWGTTSVFDVLSQIVSFVRILHRQEWVT